MLEITKAMDIIEQNYKNQFLKNPKKLYDKNFYASLFGIAKELFGKRQNSIIQNFERAKNTSNYSPSKDITGLSKTDKTFISKILKNVNNYDNGPIKELSTVDELLEYFSKEYQSNLQVTDLILLQVAMEYLSSIYNTSIFYRVANIMSEYSSSPFSENALFNSLLHYTQRTETLGKPQYIQNLNFIYLLINHLKYFFNNVPLENIKNFITVDTFYCDEDLIINSKIAQELEDLCKLYCKIFNFENDLRRNGIYLEPSELEIRLNTEFTFEELSSYYNINNSDSDNANNLKVDIKDSKKFITRIKEALSKAYGGNQNLLATVLSMSPTSVNSYFSPRKLPKSFPVKIAYALNVTPDYLAGITENSNEFKDRQGETIKIFYNYNAKKFDYEYQYSDEYHKLKDSINSMPEPFQKVIELMVFGKKLEHIIIIYNKENLWQFINGYGCNLNEKKLDECKEHINKFKESHKEQYEVMQNSYNELLKLFLKIYFNNIEHAHTTLTKDFLNLENELNEIIYSKKN